MKVTVCIGSSCHIKGSRQVVEQLQELIAKNDLGDKVELAGAFCMGRRASAPLSTASSSPSPPTLSMISSNRISAQR